MSKKFVLCLGLLAAAAPRPALAQERALDELQEAAPTKAPEPSTPAAQQAPVQADKAAAGSPAQQLLTKSRQELDDLYRASAAGPIPDGAALGAASVAPGTLAGEASRRMIANLWKGKVFERVDDVSATLVNKTAAGENFAAKVYFGDSRLDGKTSIIIDYGATPFKPFRIIRDEIRLVAPGVYLGYAYLHGVAVAPVVFALDFNASDADTARDASRNE